MIWVSVSILCCEKTLNPEPKFRESSTTTKAPIATGAFTRFGFDLKAALCGKQRSTRMRAQIVHNECNAFGVSKVFFNQPSEHPFFGEVISVYTRAQADSVLIDAEPMAREAGFLLANRPVPEQIA